VELLVPELRRRGIYAEIPQEAQGEEWTAREKVYGKGQAKLRDDHTGAGYRYDVYDDTVDGATNGGEERPSKRQKR
jgi:hypothetical protein